MNKLLTTTAAIALLGLSGAANALSITNGSFETGDFTGWGTQVTDLNGATTVVTTFTSSGGEITYSATDGTYFAALEASSMIFQNQTWSVGETLSFDWAFAAYDYLPFDDTAYFNVLDTFGAVIDSVLLSSVSSVGDFGETDWATFSYTFAASGVGSLVFFMDDIQDTIWNSYLFVDNVTAVPEPSILALMGLGLVGIGFSRRRANLTLRS